MASTEIKEINKEIEVTPMMQLIDLNGTIVNFQTEFTISTENDNILVAIVNQPQLDHGDFDFEPIKNTFARRITYQDNIHQNHYLAIKCEQGKTGKCKIISQIKPLPVIKKRDKNVHFERDPKEDVNQYVDKQTVPRLSTPIGNERQPSQRMTPLQDPEHRAPQRMAPQDPDHRAFQRMAPPQDPEHRAPQRMAPPQEQRNLPDPRMSSQDPRMNHAPERGQREETHDVHKLSPTIKQEIHDQLADLCQKENYMERDHKDDHKDEHKDEHKPKKMNLYYIVGIVCLLICFILICKRFMKK
jgi:hypothetical protein